VTEVRAGIYRHYKGQLYLALGLAHDANAEDLVPIQDVRGSWERRNLIPGMLERTVVEYVPLQLDGAPLGPRMAVRTAEDFLAPVEITEGVGAEGGWKVPRFTYLGPELTADMLG